MNRRVNILANLRRRSVRLGRAMLALFVAASITASASPCLAMGSAAQAADEAQTALAAHVAHASHAAHDHTTAHGALFSHAHAATDHVASDGSAAHPAAHDSGSVHSHGHCPHCPASAAASGEAAAGAHAFCSASDGLSDSGQSSAPRLLLDHLALLAHFELPPAPLLRPASAAISHAVRPAYASVALNLRHCVFLI